jgi:hypothetical protein
VGIAAHIARLRAVVGYDLLLLPSVSMSNYPGWRRERPPGFLRPAKQNGPDWPPSLRLAESGQLQ